MARANSSCEINRVYMYDVFYMDGYKLIYHRVVVKPKNITPLLTFTDTDIQTNKVIGTNIISFFIVFNSSFLAIS